MFKQMYKSIKLLQENKSAKYNIIWRPSQSGVTISFENDPSLPTHTGCGCGTFLSGAESARKLQDLHPLTLATERSGCGSYLFRSLRNAGETPAISQQNGMLNKKFRWKC